MFTFGRGTELTSFASSVFARSRAWGDVREEEYVGIRRVIVLGNFQPPTKSIIRDGFKTDTKKKSNLEPTPISKRTNPFEFEKIKGPDRQIRKAQYIALIQTGFVVV